MYLDMVGRGVAGTGQGRILVLLHISNKCIYIMYTIHTCVVYTIHTYIHVKTRTHCPYNSGRNANRHISKQTYRNSKNIQTDIKTKSWLVPQYNK